MTATPDPNPAEPERYEAVTPEHPLDNMLGAASSGQDSGRSVTPGVTPAPEPPPVEDISQTLRDLIAQTSDSMSVDLGAGVAAQRQTTPNAMITDGWTEMMAREMAAEDWNLNDDGFTRQSNPVEVTDAMTAAFDYFPAVDPDCASIMRRRWYESLLASKDFRELHVSTAGNEDLATLAAEQFATSYQTYLGEMTEDQAQAATNPVDSLSTEMDRHGSASQAAQAAGQEIQEAQDLCHAFGDSACKTLSTLFKAAKNNPDLRRIAELAGKYRRLAQSLQNSKPVEGCDDVVGVTLGSDVGRLIVSELSNLSVPELELDTLRRVVEGEAHIREYESVAQENRGPIMLLVDESGSMDGDPIQQAKAMAMAMVWLASHQNRWCCLVGWSSLGQVRSVALPPHEDHQEQVVDWCSQMFNGGTEPPVGVIAELFEAVGAPEGKTDVIWLTDGHCHIPAHEVEAFNEFRRVNSVRSFCLGIGCEPTGFLEICDEVHTVENLTADSEEVENILSI